MILAFDLDGTLCDMWYGKNSPDLYSGERDQATRCFYGDCYKYVKFVPGALEFLRKYTDRYNKAVVISRISAGEEYQQKIKFLKRNAKKLGPKFETDNIFGTTTDKDKLFVLEMLSRKTHQPVMYFDDSIQTICEINNMPLSSHSPGIYAFHSSVLLTRTYNELERCLIAV